MEIVIILGLIALNAFFSLAEIALISSRQPRLESQAHKGDDRAKRALDLIGKPDVFLSTVQIGITLVGILTGIFSGDNLKVSLAQQLSKISFLAPYSHALSTTIIVVLITYCSLVFGELVPKRIGLNNPESVAKWVTPIMDFLLKISYPFIWIVNQSSNIVVRLMGITKTKSQVSEEEIKFIIEEGTRQGTLQAEESQIIDRVFALGDRNITSMMTHRNDLVWLDTGTMVDDIESHYDLHSVYPVCENEIDQIKGVVFIKDLFAAKDGTKVETLIKPVFFVPENISAYHLLEKFKLNKLSYAIIVDEYGSLLGMITMHDILASLVGDFGEVEGDEPDIIPQGDGSFLIDGQTSFYDFLDYFECTELMDEDSDEDDDFDTVAGFMLMHLEHIPVKGESVDWKHFHFEVQKMDGHRIDRILLKKIEQPIQDIDE